MVPKPGDLVKVRCTMQNDPVGVVIWVNEQYPPNCCVLIDGKRSLEDLRVVEVIVDSR